MDDVIKAEMWLIEAEHERQVEQRLQVTRNMKETYEEKEKERLRLAKKAVEEWAQKQADRIQLEKVANKDVHTLRMKLYS